MEAPYRSTILEDLPALRQHLDTVNYLQAAPVRNRTASEVETARVLSVWVEAPGNFLIFLDLPAELRVQI